MKLQHLSTEELVRMSLECRILRDHMRLINCELIDNQEHVLVGVSFHLQPQQ